MTPLLPRICLCAAFLLWATLVEGQPANEGAVASTEQFVESLRDDSISVQELMAIAFQPPSGIRLLLQEKFERESNKLRKQWLAVALIRSGEDSREPIDYLIDQARPLVETDMPSPFMFDENGKHIRRRTSPEFEAWCEKQGLDPGSVLRDIVYIRQQDLSFLVYAGDPRASGFLRQALLSSNYVTAANAARGLVAIHGPGAVADIAGVCRKLPADAAQATAFPLVNVDTQEARDTLSGCFADKTILEQLLRQRPAGAGENSPKAP